MARKKRYTEEVMTAFLECKSIREISERTGLSRTMIEKYRADEGFKNELAKRRTMAIQKALARMQMSLADVVSEVLAIATDKEISPQIRLNAAQIVLTQCRSWTETNNLMERISALEQAASESEKLLGGGGAE